MEEEERAEEEEKRKKKKEEQEEKNGRRKEEEEEAEQKCQHCTLLKGRRTRSFAEDRPPVIASELQLRKTHNAVGTSRIDYKTKC